MAGVPFVFGNATTSIPLSNLDANFNTGLTIGNTTVGLGNTVTTLGNVTLTNVNIVSGTVPSANSIVNGTSNVVIASSSGNINVGISGANVAFFKNAGVALNGTTTNNDASAGQVGEYISAQLSNPGNSLTSSSFANVISISLTAGDWDVTGFVGFVLAASTSISYYALAISTVSQTLNGQGTAIDSNFATTVPGAGSSYLTPTVRVSLASTTTVYLVTYLIFGVSTAKAYGNIRARRIR